MQDCYRITTTTHFERGNSIVCEIHLTPALGVDRWLARAVLDAQVSSFLQARYSVVSQKEITVYRRLKFEGSKVNPVSRRKAASRKLQDG